MRDVRMRGFAQRADVDDVLRTLASRLTTLDGEPVELAGCADRVLALAVRAQVNVPTFPRSAMDGYALRGEDTFGASSYNTLKFALLGESMPGMPFAGRVEAGQAVRIMTGAPLPEGADTVAPAEICTEDADRVQLSEAVPPKKHVGATGEDVKVGDQLLSPGRRLRPQDVAIMASVGMTSAFCVRQPRVQLIMTGNELLAPGSRPEGAKIVDSNSLMLRALVARDGGLLVQDTLLPDQPDRIREALANSDADVTVVSGGSSVGKEDHAPRMLAELGELDYHGVTLRPASPSGGGRIGERFVFLCPGNPVSALCAYEFFAGPAIRVLGGRYISWPHRRLSATLGRKIVSQVGRTDYVRVALEDGKIVPLATSGASILSSTVRAVGAVIVARGLEGLDEGASVEVLLYDEEQP